MSMQKFFSLTLSFALVVIFASSTTVAQNPLADENEIAFLAYQYALPLVLMDLTLKYTTNVNPSTGMGAPVNQFFHVRTPTLAHDKTVVRMNVDTLYSYAFLDLSEEPIIFSKPKTDRYSSIAVYDAYSNIAEILGTGGIDNGSAAVYAIFGPDHAEKSVDIPMNAVRLDMPTNMVWIVTRTHYDMNSLAEIHTEIQDNLTFVPLSQYGNTAYIPPGGSYDPAYDYVPIEKLFSLSIDEFFNAFNELSIQNPGTDDDIPALTQFAQIGVGAGLEFRLDDFSLEVQEKMHTIPEMMYRMAIDAGSCKSSSPYFFDVNNWIYPDNSIARFGTAYDFRAIVAVIGFGANPTDMAVYPSTDIDKEGNVLNGNNNYVIRFEAGEFPPCMAFWSITLYDEDGFFYDNSAHKQAIRGTDSFITNSDGSVDIYLQNKSPGETLESNWLPSPEGDFSLVLRIYQPEESVLDFTWKPPSVERIS